MYFLGKLMGSSGLNQLTHSPLRLPSICATPFKSVCGSQSISETTMDTENVFKLISDHPFPISPIRPMLLQNIPASILSTTFVENVICHLSSANSNALKAFEFLKFSLHSNFCPSSNAFEKTLSMLLRVPYFDEAWELMGEIRKQHPSLLTLKSMSIMLQRIAKFQSHEAALRAFIKMEKDIFVGKKFGTSEFNVLLLAFCTQRWMVEAHSLFKKLHPQFHPNATTMNILLLGFKGTGDFAAMEMFYHNALRRGFRPNNITYTIRINACCRKGFLNDGLRLFHEMQRANCLPTLATYTALIHGAGVAQNASMAWELFRKIGDNNLQPDTGAYNTLILSLIKANDVRSALKLVDEMENKNIRLDDLTYQTMFLGLMALDSIDGVENLYWKMVGHNFMPSAKTVQMLMKIFCQNYRLDLGLDLWEYLMKQGYCPHRYVLDLLVVGLCARGKGKRALECSVQMLERGMPVSEGTFRVLERFLLKAGKTYLLRMLDDKIKRVRCTLPPSRGLAVGLSSSTLVDDYRRAGFIAGPRHNPRPPKTFR